MRRKILAAAFAVTTLGGVALAAAVPAYATGATVVRPGQSIQAAVDAADPGDTIVVLPGTYAETVFVGTDGLTLRGSGARLVPPAEAPMTPCAFPDETGEVVGQQDGICVLGDVDFETGAVLDPVEDVTVTGFHVEGFAFNGIVAVGGTDVDFTANTTVDNGEYGLAMFVVTDSVMRANTATGSAEAGLYLGDSPAADSEITGNVARDNGFGVFVRDSSVGAVTGNRVSENCVGIHLLTTYFLTGDWSVRGNIVTDNTRACPAVPDGPPAFSGLGILLTGGGENHVVGNIVTDNRATGPSFATGGVAVVASPAEEAPAGGGNLIKGNIARDNDPDLFWDEAEPNTFRANVCETSVLDGLC